MTIKADSPDDYVSKVPEERREAFSALRKVINDNLPVPHSIYPAGYHCNPKEPLPHISLGSQKNHIGLYMMCIYGSEEAHDAFVAAWKATGHKLDMGKSCVRIKKWDAIPFDVIGAEVAKHSVDSVISFYESVIKR
jgi:hypothetical protein